MAKNLDDKALLIKKGLQALCEFQADLDDATWQIQSTLLAKFRHISLHLSVVNGSIAGLCEKWEHAILKNEETANNLMHLDMELLGDVVADLIIHAAQLSNIMGGDLFSILSHRVARNVKRFAPDSNLNLDVD